MTKTEEILRKSTMNLFNDTWYIDVTRKLMESQDVPKGYVYFIGLGKSNVVKIGYSYNLIKRLESFKTVFRNQLYLYGYIYTEDFRDKENELHKKFFEFRTSGEWFKLNRSQIINCLKDEGGQLVNGYITKKSNIVLGEFYGFKDEVTNIENDAYYADLYNFLDEYIKEGVFYRNSEVRDLIRDIDVKYHDLSPKKIVMKIKQWANHEKMNYQSKNSSGVRSFMIHK
jgi:hypothetical protein